MIKSSLPAGFSVVELKGTERENTIRVWTLVKPDLDTNFPYENDKHIPVRVWCDCDCEPNPSNGKFGRLIREKIPQGCIWEMNGVYFSYDDQCAAFWNPDNYV